MYGRDQAASITPKTFAELIEEIRVLEVLTSGSNEKKILDIEIPVAEKLRAHIKKI